MEEFFECIACGSLLNPLTERLRGGGDDHRVIVVWIVCMLRFRSKFVLERWQRI